MIEHFWNWIFQSVQSAAATVTNIYTNPTIKPFADLLLAVVGLIAVMKFILQPLLGYNYSGASDKVKKKKERDK